MPKKENVPAPEDMLQVLSGEDYDMARGLHELGEALGCKVEGTVGAKAYRIAYSVKKPKRSLFTIECSDKKWRVKANLFNIDAYHAEAGKSSKELKQHIINTRPCVDCNPKCAWHPAYHIDGGAYRPCYGAGHYFNGLTQPDFEKLKDLIRLECAFLKAQQHKD